MGDWRTVHEWRDKNGWCYLLMLREPGYSDGTPMHRVGRWVQDCLGNQYVVEADGEHEDVALRWLAADLDKRLNKEPTP